MKLYYTHLTLDLLKEALEQEKPTGSVCSVLTFENQQKIFQQIQVTTNVHPGN